MGFWYLLLFLTGLAIAVFGLMKIKTVGGMKWFGLFVIGVLVIALSLFMFTPKSSEVIARLLNLP